MCKIPVVLAVKETSTEICSEECLIEEKKKKKKKTNTSVGFSKRSQMCAHTFHRAFIFVSYAYVLRAVVN